MVKESAFRDEDIFQVFWQNVSRLRRAQGCQQVHRKPTLEDMDKQLPGGAESQSQTVDE